MHGLRLSLASYLLIGLCFLRNVLASPSRLHSLGLRQYDKGESKIDENSANHHLEFYSFVTRPDIDAPRWNIRVYDKDALSPGYWFMATYEYVEQEEYDRRAWVGPHIYDQNGELIWSGAPMFKGYNVKDFKVSNVAGTPMLTGIYTKEHTEVVLDSSYEMYKQVPIEPPQQINIHGFNMVDNGTRSLAMTLKTGMVTRDEMRNTGYDGRCLVSYPGFEERDTATWEPTFIWNAQGHIHVDEVFVRPSCRRIWDYLHANSIDKFPDGDYLLSGRHSDTLYKISGKDGSIVWRLGGKYSNFSIAGHFSGQHDARVREQNETHTIISIMDNAIRPGSPHITNDQSRGMILFLDTDPQTMRADVLKTYNHPHAAYAPGRGNFQMMDNGNAFLGWWMRSLISENAPDGKLLMEASWIPELKSYRSYKFEWVGHPKQPPDVHSRAVNWTEGVEAEAEAVQTIVYVSWNGATEVSSWNLYKTTADGDSRTKIVTIKRQGFETMMTYEGFASYVVVEGVDISGNSLGVSDVVKTIPPEDTFGPAIVQESKWIQDHSAYTNSWLMKSLSILLNPLAAYICGIVTSAVIVLVLRRVKNSTGTGNTFSWIRNSKSKQDGSYEPLWNSDQDFADEDDLKREEAQVPMQNRAVPTIQVHDTDT